MKYLKLYESYFKRSVKDYINTLDYPIGIGSNIFSCINKGITDLKGIESLINLEYFNCASNKLVSLKGIENLIKLKMLHANDNQLENLNGIENCIKLEALFLGTNSLKNLKGIENLINIQEFWCSYNLLNDLEELKNLKNIKILVANTNQWKYPLPKKLYELSGENTYSSNQINKFETYELQKEFLTKFPERVKDLEPIGIHEKIKEKFADIIEGNEFGFFGLK